MKGNPVAGARYLLVGFSRLREPGLRSFVLIPLLINMLLMGLASWWGISYLSEWTSYFAEWLPAWLQWLYWIVMPLAVITLVVILAYSFSTLLMVLMAPFNGLLSEQVDRGLGNDLPNESLWSLTKRTVWRELIKLVYLLPRYAALLLLSFIPVVNMVAPVLWVIFTSWVLAIQYTDYSFDNRQQPFRFTKQTLPKHSLTALGFGAAVMLLISIPIVNWFVIPAAIIGATQMCHEQKIRAA